MAQEENISELANQLKERGLTCKNLQARRDQQKKESVDFQKLGFQKIADVEKQVADQLNGLYNKVCRKI
jgi:hypothetical protein